MTNLGIIYAAEDIRQALQTPHPQPGFILVGLTFYKTEVDPRPSVAANSLGGFLEQLSESRRFNIDAIFYRQGAPFQDINIVLTQPTATSKFTFQDRLTNTFDNANSISIGLTAGQNLKDAVASERQILENGGGGGRARGINVAQATATVSAAAAAAAPGASLAISDYQFWNNIVGFVFFGKAQLEAILMNTDEITISGAEINYGTGVFDHAVSSTGNVSYPTLKAETGQRINLNEYVPDIIVGLPCPPIWGSGELSVKAGIPELASEKANTSWRNFAENYIQKIALPSSTGKNTALPKVLKTK